MISAEIICFFLLYFGNVKKQDILSINHEIQGEIANKSATHSRKEQFEWLKTQGFEVEIGRAHV